MQMLVAEGLEMAGDDPSITYLHQVCLIPIPDGLVFKAHRRYVSLNSRLESNKEEEVYGVGSECGGGSGDGRRRPLHHLPPPGNSSTPSTLGCILNITYIHQVCSNPIP